MIKATNTAVTKVETPASLGEAIRLRRASLQLGQANLAALTGVGTRFLSELERGKPTCEIGKILEVLTGLGLEVWLYPRGQHQ